MKSLAFCCVLALASCDPDPAQPPAEADDMTTVSLAPTDFGVLVCASVQMALSVGSRPVSVSHFRWRTSNASLLQVSDSGRVTGVAPGTAKLSAVWKDDTTVAVHTTVTVASTGQGLLYFDRFRHAVLGSEISSQALDGDVDVVLGVFVNAYTNGLIRLSLDNMILATERYPAGCPPRSASATLRIATGPIPSGSYTIVAAVVEADSVVYETRLPVSIRH